MNFPDTLFTFPWSVAAWGLLGALILASAWSAPWRRLAEGDQFNVWAGAIVVLMLLWSMKAGVKPGLNLHLLGVTALTLMFGWQLAVLALCVVLAAVTVNGGAGWQSYGLNGLVMAMFPVMVSQALMRLVTRRLPANLFVYVFCAAFLGAALVTAATGVLAALLLWAAGVYGAETLLGEFLPYFLLLGFAEAWLNGAAITLMVVYRPHWVGSFDERRYLSK